MSERPIVVGVDVGGTSVHGVVLDVETREVLEETKQATMPEAQGVLAGVVDTTETLARGRTVAAVGVGVPGLVGAGTVAHAVNLGIGADPLDLVGTLRALCDGPVAVENDVKAAAVGARLWLDATEPGVEDYALLNVGTGLAAGLVLDGALRRGGTGLAGEIGHLPFDRGGPLCKCGKRGCLELYASGSGIRRSWPGTAAELFDRAATGDDEAARLVEDLVAGLAHAITLLAYTVDVERVLVTGGVVSATPDLRSAVLARLEEDGATPMGLFAGVAERVRWLPADEPVGAIGAALLALAACSR